MNYAVDWLPQAEIALADAWLQAVDPGAVTKAQAEIDRLLARDPIGKGQHLHEGLHQLIVSPLTVFYSVDVTARRVEVSQVWYTPMKNDKTPFDSVRKVLRDLGFVETVVPGPYLLFEHSPSGTLLPYRAYQSGDADELESLLHQTPV
jgi:hypothetical protein